MDGLDLLLAVGNTVEKVHQSAWYALLKHSAFLAELGLTSADEREVTWEPDGKAFDLRVTTIEGPVWIELKIDSELGEAQLLKQLEHGKSGRCVYALLGFADIRSRPWATALVENKGGMWVDGATVVKALRRVEKSIATAPAAKQLAGAYADQLEKLGQRGQDFRSTRSWWSAHSLYFFDRLRRECPEMENAIVTYAPNAAGGFEACHWGWLNADGGVDCYLQWEHQTLCFKISVGDPRSRAVVQSAAAKFLDKQRLGPVVVSRPTRLRSGQTMTVGVVDELPVQEARGTWEELIGAMKEATRLNEQLAEILRER